ncbi:MAG: hypothetical protein M0R46_16725 [Candidatus Muirbacterium halophilum]|nr:hypothetical protein [Candidatus Muirbacterium halophilum]
MILTDIIKLLEFELIDTGINQYQYQYKTYLITISTSFIYLRDINCIDNPYDNYITLKNLNIFLLRDIREKKISNLLKR